ncbi:hypothetical protein KKC17_02195 [Patescibacteria group bacterium]|nr:hypothetical protein [Patescibacteria group bacterium]
MIDKRFFKKLKTNYQRTQIKRRWLTGLASEAQHLSKQSIFVAQRGDLALSVSLLTKATGYLKKIQPIFKKFQDLENLGVYRAALEEYVEAKLFLDILKHQPISSLPQFNISPEIYLGAVSDAIGETVRLAVKYAAQSKVAEVKSLQILATNLTGWLAEFNLTGPLRSKFDQAKRHLIRLEEINYDLAIKKNYEAN